MNNDIGISVIGCGGMGMAIVKRLIARDPRLKVRTIYDPSPESVTKALDVIAAFSLNWESPVLGVMGGLVLLESLWRFVTGRLPESELIGIRESEEEPVDAPAPIK